MLFDADALPIVSITYKIALATSMNPGSKRLIFSAGLNPILRTDKTWLNLSYLQAARKGIHFVHSNMDVILGPQ